MKSSVLGVPVLEREESNMSKSWKKTYLGILVLLAAISLSACTPTERQVTEQAEETEALEKWKDKMPKDMPERITLKLSEGVEVDAFLEVSGELVEWKTEELIIIGHLLDEKKCLDDLLELLGNPKVKQREHVIKEDTLEDGTPLTCDSAYLGKDKVVQARNLYFLANLSPENIWHKDNFIIQPDDTFDKVEKNKELSIGRYDEICKKLEEFLEKQEIKNVLNPTIYSFTPKLLQKYADKCYQEYMSAGLEKDAQRYHVNYTEDDGEYLIRYTQGYKGIPYDYLSLVENDVDGTSYISGTDMSVFYGKQGITMIKSGRFYDMKQVGEEKRILSLYEILKKFRDSHKREADKMISIKQIGLSYLPILKNAKNLEFDAVPVWYLIYDDKLAEMVSGERKIATYHAATGECYT